MKWEYKSLYLLGDELESLSELGSRGWELVAINPGTEEWESAKAYLKRPIHHEFPGLDQLVNNKKISPPVSIYEYLQFIGAGLNISGVVEEHKKYKQQSNTKELLFQFRSMVLELLEAGNMIPSEVKKKAYLLIDSCYDDNGELIA